MKNIQLLKGMIQSGINNLYNFYPHIDKLNVFPVPDGDTGTNMNLTCTNAFSEIENVKFNNFNELMAKFSRGLIMGARGNSGVIFSQIMKGFSNGFKDSSTLDIATIKKGFANATEVAYAAVMKPVEGTMLTVIRETSENVQTLSDDISLVEFFEKVCEFSNVSLENTPNLLAALKEVGVVDSGGFGLVKMFEGMLFYLKTNKIIAKTKKLEENLGGNLDLDIEGDEFGYCTETIVLILEEIREELKVDIIRKKLEEFGNTSIVAVKDEDILKIHTHAISPGTVLTYLEQFGEFSKIKIENMTQQADTHVSGGTNKYKKINSKDGHTSFKNNRNLANDVATIGVVRSKEMRKYFLDELNMDYVIDGGSKMNPSTEEFLKAIESVDAKQVYLFPNDGNVILAAKQAKDLEKKSKVTIIPTRTIPEGMAAFLNLDIDEKPAKNEINLTKLLKNVQTYSTTIAVLDTEINGVKVSVGQYVGILGKNVIYSADKIIDIFNKSLSKYITNKTEIITIFSGSSATLKEINDLRKYLDENHDVEYEIVEGGQDTYSFIIGIE